MKGPTSSSVQPFVSGIVSTRPRVGVDGKFFRLAGKKFPVKGVSYGPFAPVGEAPGFPGPALARRDFDQIRHLGATVIRVYNVPPRWLLDLAEEFGLKLLVDIPWNHQCCFLDDAGLRRGIVETVRKAAEACAFHPAVFAILVANEIPPDVARWSGPGAVAGFIDELIEVVKGVDPDCLCSFASFPTTEFLRPQRPDFLCFNVYLHQQKVLENYLARLQMQADTRPLVLSEFGIDTVREGVERQVEIVGWSLETLFRGGLAGGVIFSYTDEWWKDGRRIEDWAFGLTRMDRSPKPAWSMVKDLFAAAPLFPLPRYPFVTVVIAAYNAASTLKLCLESLEHLNYPAYEVVLVDDGSTDATPGIAALFPRTRYIRHEQNAGLSVARNTGIDAARGEIIAFTDADCRPDEDWLYFVVSELARSGCAAVGGPNYLPPDDSAVAAAVMASPGGPAHVMLTDRLAEHIPGCNMVFWRWALEEIGCFDPVFRAAGDDVDVCWRLLQRGYQIGFSPSGFVWHYRRSTVRAYLKQQRGYGDAEALLVRKHPEYFNWAGSSMWRGRIYSAGKDGVTVGRPIIYHGLFGTGLFQTLYTPPPAGILFFFTSLEYYVTVVLPLAVLALGFGVAMHLALASLLVPLGIGVCAGWQAVFPPGKQRFWSRPLVALLHCLQPVVRGWARYRGRLAHHPTPLSDAETLESASVRYAGPSFRELHYWTRTWVDRVTFLKAVADGLDSRGWQNKTDTGWQSYDIEIQGSRWSRLNLTTAMECYHMGEHVLRCRLNAHPTLFAEAVLYGAAAVQIILLGVFARETPWPWLILGSLALYAIWLRREQRDLQRLTTVFLDEVAAGFGMIRSFPKPGVTSPEGGRPQQPRAAGSSEPTAAVEREVQRGSKAGG